MIKWEQQAKEVLPGIEPGSQEMLYDIKILSDNHYTIAPYARGWGKHLFNYSTIERLIPSKYMV